MSIIFFDTPAALRAWLEENHDKATELWVGLYKKSSGRPSITWPELVDEVLCFGWIDGIRKSIDDVSYKNRITPRKPRSNWSAVNIRRVQELIKLGRMTPAGLKAFEARQANRVGGYSYEQRSESLPAPYDEKLKANKKACAYWQSQTPSYRKLTSWWVVSARKEETRQKRLAQLIELSAAGETIPQFTRTKSK
ncbi:MAG TPA: YdeI/OmpD-associated family protein [Blastocatellia bacterium]|nr:YdeI/OmpD-associated family protein [Blastocatellia bacterium]